MKKEYLPSRQFLLRIVILVVILAAIVGVYELIAYLRSRNSSMLRTPVKLQVKDIVQKDTNTNGIPDWEESLWGLDPNINGPENKAFILAKRKALAEQNGGSASPDEAAPANENEALAREFFAVIMSLEQTGNLDADAMESVSEAIGKKIVADPIPDIYSRGMLILKDSDEKSTDAYFEDLKTLFLKYKDKNIGDELMFIATALKDNDQGALAQITVIGGAYRSFGKELMKIGVPNTLAATHLALANDYEKVAISVDGLSRLLSEPIVGMKGVINYKKYSDELVLNMETLSDNL